MPTDTRARLLSPAPELPDDTPIEQLELPARIKRVLQAEGLNTVYDVRETSDKVLISFRDMGPGSVKYLRNALGLPSEEGVRCDKSRVDPADAALPQPCEPKPDG
jgi:DNA-directed RNA polymerase alpha subunit